jgi:hypothetical protein
LVGCGRRPAASSPSAAEHAAEVLPQPPSRWHLTGFLVPQDALEDQREDATAGEGAEELRESTGADDSTVSDAPPTPTRPGASAPPWRVGGSAWSTAAVTSA